MATTPAEADNAITGTVMFYKAPQPLSVEQHGKLGLRREDRPYAFAAEGHMTPLTVTEFANAAGSFPIIFVGDDKTPVGVLGLNAGESLFAEKDGSYTTGAYIPAYIRRYPFVLANDEGQQRMIVCIDRGSDLLVEGGEQPLFDDKGQPTEYTQNAIKFCDDFETERRRTESFVKLLIELDLLERTQSQFTPTLPNGQPGQPQLIAEFWGVSEEKLNKLPADKYIQLRDNGALSQIYAHLLSLNNWDKLIAIASSKSLAANAA
ncbi:MAG: peptidase [Caulobacterales bacterium 68-7]|nr:SapC family protein [Caulobacterales bacterium]OJU08603.1 MAG: peptidase [Caulobacterales bacterium 68-7]